MHSSYHSAPDRFRYNRSGKAPVQQNTKKSLGIFLSLTTVYYFTNAVLTLIALFIPLVVPNILSTTGSITSYDWRYNWQVAAYNYGIPSDVGQGVVSTLAIAIPFIIGYGLISRTRWGFWLAAFFHGYLLLLNLIRALDGGVALNWPGIVLPALVLASLWTNEDRFFPEDTPVPHSERL